MSSLIIKNLSSFLSVFIQSLNFPSLFPAIFFTFLVKNYVFPFLPLDSWVLEGLLSLDDTSALILLILIVLLLATLLDSANLPIIRLFEGYPLLKQFPFDLFVRCNQDNLKQIQKQIHWLEKEWDTLLQQCLQEEDSEKKREMQQKLNYYTSLLSIRYNHIINKYPDDVGDVLPFKLGNVIAAAEQYPKKTFGMDAIVLWPFLRNILSDKPYAQLFVRDKSSLDFLLNMIVILASFALLFLITKSCYDGWSTILLIKVIAVFIVCFLFLKLAVQSAANWGATLKAGFVVFREDLRINLKLIEVSNYEQERQLWKKVSDFFRTDCSDQKLQKLGEEIFKKE